MVLGKKENDLISARNARLADAAAVPPYAHVLLVVAIRLVSPRGKRRGCSTAISSPSAEQLRAACSLVTSSSRGWLCLGDHWGRRKADLQMPPEMP